MSKDNYSLKDLENATKLAYDFRKSAIIEQGFSDKNTAEIEEKHISEINAYAVGNADLAEEITEMDKNYKTLSEENKRDLQLLKLQAYDASHQYFADLFGPDVPAPTVSKDLTEKKVVSILEKHAPNIAKIVKSTM